MKRIHVELILAILILAWTVGNMVLTGEILFSCFSFAIQFIVLLAVATAEGDESGN